MKTIGILILTMLLFTGCSGIERKATEDKIIGMQKTPPTPNVVSSYVKGPYHRDAIKYEGETEEVKERLIEILKKERGEIKSIDGNYIHAIFKTRVFRFVDDAEFLFDEENKEINFKLGARLGISDFGVNGRRLRKIKKELSKTN